MTMNKNALRFILGAALSILFLISNWNASASHSSSFVNNISLLPKLLGPYGRYLKAGADVKNETAQNHAVLPNGIRLAAPLCGETDLIPVVFAPPCQGPPATLSVGIVCGNPPFSVSVTGPDGRSVPVLPSDGFLSPDIVKIAEFVATQAGEYKVRVRDANGEAEVLGGLMPCSSLTQSEWGKKKPKFDGEKRPKTINRVFSQFSDLQLRRVLAVGVPGAGSKSVRFFDDAASCIRPRLPASGPIGPLPAGLGDAIINPDTCQTSPPLPLVGDKFQNELLGQAIALTLNAGGVNDFGGLTYDDEGHQSRGLWHLVICGHLVTQGALPGNDGMLGTHDDLLDPGLDGIPGTQDDPRLTVTIPTSVIRAIAVGSSLESSGKFRAQTFYGSRTVPAGSVGRLLVLANLALAGETQLGGASLADINAAVDAVNRAFDRCRFLISCTNAQSANLQITFDPDPVPQDTLNRCSGARPNWLVVTRLAELGGLGITITRFTVDYFGSNGESLGTGSATGDEFANYTDCNNVRVGRHIAAHGDVCIAFCFNSLIHLDRQNSGSIRFGFEGTDDNGNHVSFSSTRLVLLGS